MDRHIIILLHDSYSIPCINDWFRDSDESIRCINELFSLGVRQVKPGRKYI